jgi:hypothetical protein
MLMTMTDMLLQLLLLCQKKTFTVPFTLLVPVAATSSKHDARSGTLDICVMSIVTLTVNPSSWCAGSCTVQTLVLSHDSIMCAR